MRLIFSNIVLFLLSYCLVFGQETQNFEESEIFYQLQKCDSSKTKVSIYQEEDLHVLVNKHIKLNKKKNTISGYRIQIYSGSGHDARKNARKAQSKFLAKYPNEKTYLIYHQPYFKIRIGDYRTKKEGFHFYKTILNDFPEAYFVIENNMNYPKLVEKSEE